VAFLVGFTLIIIGTLSGTSPVTIIGALVTAATVATIGLMGSRGAAGATTAAKEAKEADDEADEEARPERHLEGMNFRLTDSWDIWKH
jgi:ribosomal protein L12E/L44/L45/RPP1/RPP2